MGLDFSGNANAVVDYGSGAALDNAIPFTKLFWFRLRTGFATNDRFWTKSTSADASIHINANDEIRLRSFTGDPAVAITNDSPLLGREDDWLFLAVTYDDGAAQFGHIYTGDLTTVVTERTLGVNNNTAWGDDSAQSYTVGNRSSLGLNLTGEIAMFADFNFAMTLAQIRRLQYSPHLWSEAQRIFSQFGFHGTGTQPDLSGHGNNGTATDVTIADHVPLGPPFAFDQLLIAAAAAETPVTSDAVSFYESLLLLTKDATPSDEALEGILTDRGPNLESEVGLTKDEIANFESLLGLTKDAGPGIEAAGAVTDDEVANFESLLGLTKDAGPNIEAGQGATKDETPNYEALQGITKDAAPFTEAEGTVTKDGGVNFETLISLLNDTVVNYESLIGVLKDAVSNIEALQGITKDAGVGSEAEGSLTVDNAANFETLISLTVDAGVNFESLITTLKDAGVNFESLVGVLKDAGTQIESSGKVTVNRTPNFETLVSILTDAGPNLESLISVAKNEASNFESLIGVLKDNVTLLEALGFITSNRDPNIEAEGQILTARSPSFETEGRVSKDEIVSYESLEKAILTLVQVAFESLITVTQTAANVQLSTDLIVPVILALSLPLDEQESLPGDVETLELDLPLDT